MHPLGSLLVAVKSPHLAAMPWLWTVHRSRNILNSLKLALYDQFEQRVVSRSITTLMLEEHFMPPTLVSVPVLSYDLNTDLAARYVFDRGVQPLVTSIVCGWSMSMQVGQGSRTTARAGFELQ